MTTRRPWYEMPIGHSGLIAYQGEWTGPPFADMVEESENCYGCEHCTHDDRVGDEDCYGYCDACAAKLIEMAGSIREDWEHDR